jgi:hypothetical protein
MDAVHTVRPELRRRGRQTTSTYVVGAADQDSALIVRVTATNQFGSTSAQSNPVQVVVNTLLTQFAPELHYDSQESYAADSAAEITDNYVPTVYSNYLKDQDSIILASSDPAEPGPTLSLAHLGSYISNSTHFLDEHNDTYAADANALHGIPGYGNKMYGRVKSDGPGPYVWLQYWFFYYYNPKAFVGGLVGMHEGDWEMLEIGLLGGQPSLATYSQHEGGETCSWDAVEKTAQGHPVVYVGEGSHANYFTAGTHPLYYLNQHLADDYANGQGPVITPTVVDVTSPPAWITWPGTWGASGRSPNSLPDHEAWSDPLQWYFDAGPCNESGALSFHDDSLDQQSGTTLASPLLTVPRVSKDGLRSDAATAPPPAPAVQATITTHRRAVIRYAFRSFPPGARRPWTLLTTVVPSGHRYFPYTVRTRITSRSGRVVQSLGRGPGPYKLLVSALTKSGTRSRIVSLPLRKP